MTIIPPYLHKGDTIGIICPSGFMPMDKVETCITVLKEWGYKVKIGSTVGNQYHYFSGTDEERLADLQIMMDDDGVNAILCARGGYGLSRIIDKINFNKFRKNPKWIIGYSDITLLHNHLLTRYDIASLHSPMAAAFNDGQYHNEYVQSLKKILSGKKPSYTCPSHKFNKTGKALGRLVGGNLSLLCHSCGTPSDIKTRNSILFLEDVGEYIYNIDRMLQQLKRCGKFDRLAGLIIGGFSDMKDTTIPFGKTISEVIAEVVDEYQFPICFNFPVGHSNENYPLKIGVNYELSVGKQKVKLKEQS